MNPLPANVDLLIQSARQNGLEYADAYAVWLECAQHPDAYTIVDTVLWIAHYQKIPITEALRLVKGVEEQIGSPFGLL